MKYDDPESAKGIPAFIQLHGLKMEEILDPLDSFSTSEVKFLLHLTHLSVEMFNEFFYRKLKPTAPPSMASTAHTASSALLAAG